MQPLLYSDLASWYRLVDPVADHQDEAEVYGAALSRAIKGRAETLLELGAGAGNNASYLKRRFRCTLTDFSEPMLALSRDLNPECEHVQGDMRSLRLNRTFDAVLVHDAVVYMTTEEDLLAAATTAFVHTRPGGAAIIAPDLLRETFRESTQLIRGDDGAPQYSRLHLRCRFRVPVAGRGCRQGFARSPSGGPFFGSDMASGARRERLQSRNHRTAHRQR